MDKIKKIIAEKQCTGCYACVDCCSPNAIRIGTDENGFKMPQIDSDACIECCACDTVCPVITYENDHFNEPDIYAARAADEIRMQSSSGGVFPVIAQYVLNMQGCCIGACWVNQDRKVRHIPIFRKEDLWKIQNSKYMQSDLAGCMRIVKQYLKEGKKVLFSGTPCQVAGLHKFLGTHDPNLLSIDVLCHGVPSDKVVEKYFEEISSGETVRKLPCIKIETQNSTDNNGINGEFYPCK